MPDFTDQELASRRMAMTLRHCRGARFRPFSVTPQEEREVIEAGLLEYVRARTIPYYRITDAGHEFLSDN